MSHPLSHHAPQAMPTSFGMAWLTPLRQRIVDAWAARRRRSAHRRDLQLLDEHALRDIGLSHHAAAEWPHSPRGGPP
jgi:uncharacterized protein YjiS (DUF1127 family)